MFECARCGSAYSASHVGVETCPRCLLLDRVQVPLAFKLFRQSRSQCAIAPRQSLERERPTAADAP